MSIRSIDDIEKDLKVVRRFDERNREAVESSDRPLVDEVFFTASNTRRKMLEKELEAAKLERAHELFELRLHSPQFSPGTIPLRTLARLAPLLNSALEQTAWREWDVKGDATNISDAFRRLINLRLVGIQEGSTELMLVGNIAPDLTGESALESGLRNFFDVLSAPNDQFADVVNGIGNSATKSVAQLMKAFEIENLAAEFSWKASDDKYFWSGRPDEITRIRTLLEEIGDPTTDAITVTGVVSTLTRKRVQIETDNGEKINARYHRSLNEQVNALHLNERRIFEVEVTSYPADTFDLKRDAYRLMAIAPPANQSEEGSERSIQETEKKNCIPD